MSDICTHQGGCHCGAVRFRIKAPAKVTVQACNCTICRMTGFLHLIVPGRDFELETSQDELSEYTFNTGTAKHLFCRHCGVKSFYVPRSNPDGFSVNVRCVNQDGFDDIVVEPFDGQNWEANAADLAHLSD